MSSEIPLIPPTDDDFAPSRSRPPLTQEEADDLPRPKFRWRLVCWLVDVALLVMVGVMVQHVFFGVEFPELPAPEPETVAVAAENATDTAAAAADALAPPGSNAEFIVNTVIAFLYFGLMHGRFGATLGKWLGRYRVRGLDGGRIGYWTSFARSFWAVGILAVPEIPRLLYPDGGFDFLSNVGAVYILFNCLCLVWDMKFERALHDRLAGTRVVMR